MRGNLFGEEEERLLYSGHPVQSGKDHKNLLSEDRDKNLFGEDYYDILFSKDYIQNLQHISPPRTVDFQEVYKNMSSQENTMDTEKNENWVEQHPAATTE